MIGKLGELKILKDLSFTFSNLESEKGNCPRFWILTFLRVPRRVGCGKNGDFEFHIKTETTTDKR